MVPTNKADEDDRIKALIDTPALDWQRWDDLQLCYIEMCQLWLRSICLISIWICSQGADGFGAGRGFGRGFAGRMGGRGFGDFLIPSLAIIVLLFFGVFAYL